MVEEFKKELKNDKIPNFQMPLDPERDLLPPNH